MKRFFHILCIYALILMSFLGLSGSSLVQLSSASAAGSDTTSENTMADSITPEPQEPAPVGCITPVTMYYQTEPAYRDFLYGGQDPMAGYGCGPTALAIAVSTLSDQKITPIDAAIWSAEHGYFSHGHGSAHGLIPDGAVNYGLTVEHLSPLTPDTMRLCLSSNKLLVFLMGPGDFSSAGHFIVAYGYDANGNLYIADPASPERSGTTWSADLLLSQLSQTAQSSGPVWVLSK